MSSFINVYRKYHYEAMEDDVALPVSTNDIDFSYPIVSIRVDHEGDREAALADAKTVITGRQTEDRVGDDGTPVSYHIVETKTLETIV